MDFDLAPALYSEYDDDGDLGIQVDALAEADHGVTPSHVLQPLGLHARPMDPDRNEEGCLCLRWHEGTEAFCIPYGDVRSEPEIAGLTKGATCLYETAAGKHRLTLDAEGKSAHLEVPTGSTVTIDVGGQLKFEMSGTTIKITGATSVELGGQLPLALHQPLVSALSAMQATLSACSAALYPPAAIAPAQGLAQAAEVAVQSFMNTGATQITRGS